MLCHTQVFYCSSAQKGKFQTEKSNNNRKVGHECGLCAGLKNVISACWSHEGGLCTGLMNVVCALVS